jgi:hypothetical protein
MSQGCGYDERPGLVLQLAPEVAQPLDVEAPLEVRAGVDAGAGVALEVDLVGVGAGVGPRKKWLKPTS